MKNIVKDYLDSGKTLQDLQNEFAISSNISGKMVCLNYSQIDSPKTNPIVRLCRGIILEMDTWNVIHYPFYRFFNFNEVLEERQKFNWDAAVALAKLDGSLFGVFFHNGSWYIATRSQIGGENRLAYFDKTFGDIFDEAIGVPRYEFFLALDEGVDYTFEIVSPFNKIITAYDKSALYLINARAQCTSKEFTFKQLVEECNEINDLLENETIKLPKAVPLVDENGKFRGFDEMIALSNSGKADDEGFVVVDFSSYDEDNEAHPRTKVKSASYVAMNHMKGQDTNGFTSYGDVLSVLYKGEQDEVLAVLPHYKDIFDSTKKKLDAWLREVDLEFGKNSEFFSMSMDERKSPEIKKKFAMSINRKYSSMLFFAFNNGYNTLKDAIFHMAAGKDGFWKSTWEKYISKF